MRYYIFRIDYNNLDYLKKEIEQGRLRQGWGALGLSLLDTFEEQREKEEWICSYLQVWKNDYNKLDYIRKKHTNLLKMLEMEKGDIIVIPKYPYWDTLSVVEVAEKYTFKVEKGIEDYGHIIRINIKKLKTFNYLSNEYSKEIHNKLRGYQTAINSVKDENIKKAIKELLSLESNYEIRELEEIIKKRFEENIKNLNQEIFTIRNNEVETLVEKIFINQGYVVDKRNSYDGKGGDVDRIFIRNLPILGEIDNEIAFNKIYVQVKKKDGECNELEGIEQLEKIVKNLNNIENRIYKVLVCTGGFSKEVEEEAKLKGIILINGTQLMRLSLKYL
ncbi:restriction endonuclease [Fusobacterium sp.]|uniref:restriction endonuclease n=1 Tax=Fusobacterium sp. TaxID=68766 RepID=UPI0029004F27|nr:restriction endonuclease [Fusobacterium sp.]MDU1911929.1 restriction endonuclease [Fusobacterium sp.]